MPQLLEFLRLARVQLAVLRLPGVNRVLGDAHFPPDVGCRPPCLQLLDGSDHLRFRVLALRHCSSSSRARRTMKSYSALCSFRGAGQSVTVPPLAEAVTGMLELPLMPVAREPAIPAAVVLTL